MEYPGSAQKKGGSQHHTAICIVPLHKNLSFRPAVLGPSLHLVSDLEAQRLICAHQFESLVTHML